MFHTRTARVLFFLFLLTVIAILYWQRDQVSAHSVQAWVVEAGVWGALLFIGLYALGILFLFPGYVFIVAGGAVFGPWLGLSYSLGAIATGAGAAFLISRYLGHGWQVDRAEDSRWQQALAGVEREGWRYVALLRLMPWMPFDLLCYALGQTRIRFGVYLLTTLVCVVPAVVTYTYLGYVGREALVGGEGLLEKGGVAVAMVIGLGYIPRLLGVFGITLDIRHRHQPKS